MALEAERPLELPRMTEEEFVRWCGEDTRAEFVDGKVIVMPPVSLLHYEPNKFVLRLIDLYLDYRPHGRLLGPEFMVRLRPGLRRVPDLLYVRPEHEAQVRPTYFAGPPDAVWEFISPDSEERDWRDKLPEYEETGVPEYWIVNPALQTVWLYQRGADGKYASVEPEEGRLSSSVIPGFWIRTEWLWQQPLPKIMDCLREMGVVAGSQG